MVILRMAFGGRQRRCAAAHGPRGPRARPL